MKTLFGIIALAGAFLLGDIATEQWTAGNRAIAQNTSSACFQNCANVRRWPAAQCQEYCKGRTKRR